MRGVPRTSTSILLLVAQVGLALILCAILLSSCAKQGAPAPTNLPRFTTLPPGSQLPTEATCAARVQRSSWEPQPDNDQPNQRVPTAQQIAGLAAWGPDIGLAPQSDSIRKHITGNFTGTTDEILQWVACNWGIDTDLLRAEAFQESNWQQNYRGDWTTNRNLCPPRTWEGSGCYQSYGIFQIKYIDSQTTWPMSRDDTAFNAEYTYGYIRNCYEGWTTYLYDFTPVPGYPHYHAGDIWGCVGMWYSGGWYDQGALKYIKSVQTAFASKAWLNG
ncbi:MAG TPA: hypothetical protein VKR06_43940 [Ktedonosporobacter sp.]|nr:hypothetical protein [Ktedonosporobacter sp.]